MYYYIAKNKIYAFEWELDLAINPAYKPLTNEQAAFYKANPNATIYEVLNCKLNETYVEPETTLKEDKAAAIQQLSECSLAKLDTFVKAYQVANAQASLFAIQNNEVPIYDKAKSEKILSDYNAHGYMLRGWFEQAKDAITAAKTKAKVSALLTEYTNIYEEYGTNNND